MDGQRFDELTRLIASSRTRRSLLRGLVGLTGAVTGAFGVGGAGAASCRGPGDVCREHSNCCSGICGPKDRRGRSYCQCPPEQEECNRECVNPTTAYQSDPKNCGACGNRCPSTTCQAAICTDGVCGLAPNPASVGRACNDNDPCTVNDVCQEDGSCQGAPKDCSALDDQCLTGVCEAGTGNCVAQPVADDTQCDDGDLCTVTDTCQAGVCEGSNRIQCVPIDHCHVAGICDGSTGQCSTPVADRGTPCSDGNPLCIDGACCPEASICSTLGQQFCCASDQSCTMVQIGSGTFGICCDSDSAGCLVMDPNDPDPENGDFICCPSGQSCTQIDLGEIVTPPGTGLCCPSGGSTCLTVDFSGEGPFFDIVCCGASQYCAPIDFSFDLPPDAPEVTFGMCCEKGTESCLAVSGDATSTTIEQMCCGGGATCMAATYGGNPIPMSTCCATEVCLVLSDLGGDSPKVDAICCSADTTCVSDTVAGVEFSQCCPEGQLASFDMQTFETTCCTPNCLEFTGGTPSPACCGANEVCAPFVGFPDTGPLPPGKCCPAGQSACLDPDAPINPPSLVCCDNCQSLGQGGINFEFCCPTGEAPYLAIGADMQPKIACAAEGSCPVFTGSAIEPTQCSAGTTCSTVDVQLYTFGACCPSGQAATVAFENDIPVVSCCPDARVCAGDVCCPSNQTCVNNVCV